MAGKRDVKSKIARSVSTRYSAGRMGRPPTSPRSYVTRHIRFRRVLDIGLRNAAVEERRSFNDLLQLIVEDWLADRAAGVRRRRPRQPGKPARKP